MVTSENSGDQATLLHEFMQQMEESDDPAAVIEFYSQLIEHQDYWLKLIMNWYQELINSYMEGDEKITIRFDFDLAAGTCKETEISFGEAARASASKLWVPGDPSHLSLG